MKPTRIVFLAALKTTATSGQEAASGGVSLENDLRTSRPACVRRRISARFLLHGECLA